MKKFLSLILAIVFVVGICTSAPITFTANAANNETKGHYCIEATPSITDAAYDLLNEVYIEKYPEIALEYNFGSEKDRLFMKDVAEKITKGQTTDKEKVDTIIKWINDNIEYESYTTGRPSYYAIDAFHTKEANCLGVAQLIVTLCRLVNIPAVFTAGSRGDMEHYLTFENRWLDHAWAMVYIDNDWYLYDPLFDVSGTNDREFISKWYFIDDIDGVSPYVKEYLKYIRNTDGCPLVGNFYVDGKFIAFVNGMSVEEYFGTSVQPIGQIYNDCVPYIGISCSKYNGFWCDGHNYDENPERKDSMVQDELYTDGWINYCEMLPYYVRENGVRAANTLKQKGDDLYYFNLNEGIKIPGKSTDYTFTNGLLTLKCGEKFVIEEQESVKKHKENGFTEVSWEVQTPETAYATNDGEVTALADGYILIYIITTNQEGGYNTGILEFWAASEERETHYFTEEIITKESTCQTTGEKKIKCMFCDEVKTETIPTGKHQITVVGKKDATTKEAGYTGDEVCSVCNKVTKKGKEIPKLSVTLATPVVTVKNSATGVKVTWNKIENSEKYIVYSKVYNAGTKSWSGWKTRDTVTSTSWTDTSVKSGTKYIYTVKAVNGDVKSGIKSSSSILFLSQPTVKIVNASTGVKVSWNKITGATGYTIYRAEYSGGKWYGWNKMGTLKSTKTSWTDKSVKSGVKYKYTVKAVNGKTASTYKSSSSLLYLAQPKVAVKALSNGIKVAWVQSTGATSYKIYRSEYNAKTKKWSSWKGIKTAKSTSKSYVDKTAKKGVKYRYAVKAVNGKVASTYKSSSSVKR